MYFVDNGNYRIRQVNNALSKFTASDFIVPSEDGGVLYHFDENGQHLKTTHALTGAALLKVSYNIDGSLKSLTDENNLTTTIERNTAGKPVAIVSPYGQRTAITLDTAGYVASLTNPAGEVQSLTYTSTGLLTTLKDARQSQKQYTYTSDGRLMTSVDAAGGGRTLRRTELANGYEVLTTTAENEKTHYRLESIPTSGVRSTQIDAAGLTTVTSDGYDGKVTTTTPDGTVIYVVSHPDPQYGMLAAVATTTATTPGRVKSVVSHTRTITQIDGQAVVDTANFLYFLS